MKNFMSVFADRLSPYVNLRRALGYKFESEDAILKMFDKYLCSKGYKGPLTQELAIAFATQNSKASTNYRFQLYTVVRHFSEYLAAFDPKTPTLDPKTLPHTKARSCAHIFTDEEIARLLDEARRIFPKLPMLGITLYTIVGMAASTGLRISEVIALDKADVDLDTGIMTIRNSKMGKSRIVPLHPTTLEVMRSYGALRDTHYPGCDSPAFFVNSRGGRFRQNNLQVNFWKLACKAGVRTAKGQVFIPCVTPLPQIAWLPGTKVAWTSRPSCRPWPLTWGMSTTATRPTISRRPQSCWDWSPIVVTTGFHRRRSSHDQGEKTHTR